MPSDNSGNSSGSDSTTAATALRRLTELTEHLSAALFWNTGSNFARRTQTAGFDGSRGTSEVKESESTASFGNAVHDEQKKEGDK